ncbi:acetyl-CoA carboxylase biotin carboxyl carrier protein subunit [Flavobacterium sp. ASW18X]|uniref:acetyl-CoA carboxylase biotin carboxyl carrier protein subunit n=1 Tax=Flavobacterium sp. ASW18X TaxID=2572595 RepID=UPI0010AE78EF|nr:acetyl-CoA carboxylase biotin carboxyl carrier protein subunit [Flavobacterium sp. ASW18X]TKD62487.1 biotin/lipoyl-binding protein [Flavobacterium sp. ASW18X]
MENKYILKVDGGSEFSLTAKDLTQLDVVASGQNLFHVLHNDENFKAAVVGRDFQNKTYQVKINATVHTVTIQNPLATLIKDMGLSVNAGAVVNSIEAPMPGLILDIAIKVGQEVAEGDTLLILEAMKMENVLSAPRAGVIKEIAVVKGDAVEKKQVLITFE